MTVEVQLSYQVVTKLQMADFVANYVKLQALFVLISVLSAAKISMKITNCVRLSLNVISILKGKRFVVSKYSRFDARTQHMFCTPISFQSSAK